MTIRSLILSSGSTPGDAARACNVSATLFERVDAGLQPLPRVVASRLGDLLGVSTADVIAEASAFTNDASASSLRPVPARPGLEPIDGPPLAGRIAPMVARADLPALYVLEDDFGASTAAFRRRGRNDGAPGLPTTPSRCYLPRRLVELAGRLWTVSTESDPMSPNPRATIAFDPAVPSVVLEGTHDFDGPAAIVTESESGTLWIAERTGQRLSQVVPSTGGLGGFVSLSGYEPLDARAASGLVYVAALNATDPTDGRIFSIDPAVPAIARRSAAIPYLRAIASDGAGTLYAACSAPSLALWRIPENDLNAPVLLATTGAAPLDPFSLAFARGALYVSDVDASYRDPAARLVRVDLGTLEATAASYPAENPSLRGVGGELAFDGAYLWLPDMQGQLVKVHPTTLEALLVVPGAPFGAAFARV